MPDDDLTPGSDELEPEDTQSEQSSEEPKLLAGKFKNVDELEKSYREAETKMHAEAQARKEAEDRSAQWEQWYQSQINKQETVTVDVPDDEYFEPSRENIAKIVQQAAQQTLQSHTLAQAAIRREVGKRRDDPLFARVSGEYEEALMQAAAANPAAMTDPRMGPDWADQIYNATVGAYARKAAAQARETPSARAEMLRNLGLEAPSNEGTEESGDVIDRKGRDMLKELGVSKQGMSRVSERLTRLESEEQ